MRRVSGDYSAIKSGRCQICFRAIFEGMTIYNAELRTGKRVVCHSLCEQELKKTD